MDLVNEHSGLDLLKKITRSMVAHVGKRNLGIGRAAPLSNYLLRDKSTITLIFHTRYQDKRGQNTPTTSSGIRDKRYRGTKY